MFETWDKKLQKIINILESSDVNEIEVSFFGKKFKITKSIPVVNQIGNANENLSINNSKHESNENNQQKLKNNEFDSDSEYITSPMVGTFYSSPSPDSSPYVDINDNVSSGQTICIVEAMKIMNEIESDIKGKIISILVKDGDPVEYGQKLFQIKPQ
ncbi:MAG: acetyl-CoA carboxylase, biotin carboxyl carrier protein [Candidatus Marinimicrobia bacterium]|nr:acetyl-CoA carboxylase, biotin carboxyl carrier protein [Candidatus Neomarinimicrobiota bacterium]|tara:strand:+ start:1157 stop:1627 length:471 start_codon:yes stop_codon:yes gene_type:complete